MNRVLFVMAALLMSLASSAQSKKTIVAYFSATGTTQAAAETIAREHKAQLYAIQPAVKYTSADLDWHNKQSRSSIEMSNPKARPQLKEKKSLTQYDIIYLGYPIWWGVAPRIINTFIEQANLEGKTVIPFATSGSSTIDKSVTELKATYPNIHWQKGKLMNKR